jgi:hypothetical protein
MTELTNIDDFVFNITEDGKVKSSGYLVNSFLLNNTIPSLQVGGMEHLAVPAGLFYINYPNKKTVPINEDVKCISDDIYEKLFQLILNDKQKKKIKTKKNIYGHSSRKTKKNKEISILE